MDIGSISAALSSMKAVGDIARGIYALNVSHDVKQQVSDMLDQVISVRTSLANAQVEQAALLKRVDEAEREAERLKAWAAEKENYKLAQWGRGSFVYVYQPLESNVQPMHALCAHCYNESFKSILQSNGSRRMVDHFWACHRCKAEIAASSTVMLPPEAFVRDDK